MSILTDRCKIRSFYRGKSNGEKNQKVAVKNVRRVVVGGMIKQSVLKQVKRGEGVGKGKILCW